MKYTRRRLNDSTAHGLRHRRWSTPKVARLIEFCAANNITFNGYSPLGSPDFTTFEPAVGTRRKR
jgi:hypothetical protein